MEVQLNCGLVCLSVRCIKACTLTRDMHMIMVFVGLCLQVCFAGLCTLKIKGHCPFKPSIFGGCLEVLKASQNVFFLSAQEKKERVLDFQHLLIRLVSLLFATAMSRFAPKEDCKFSIYIYIYISHPMVRHLTRKARKANLKEYMIYGRPALHLYLP